MSFLTVLLIIYLFVGFAIAMIATGAAWRLLRDDFHTATWQRKVRALLSMGLMVVFSWVFWLPVALAKYGYGQQGKSK